MFGLSSRRLAAIALCAFFFGGVVVLLLADRSTGLVSVLQNKIVGAGRIFERTFEIDLIDRGDIPGTTDQVAHAALWGGGMVLVGWLARHRLSIALTALFMAAASLVFEVLQPALSTTRKFQASDVVGNVAGIAAAALLLALVIRLAPSRFRHSTPAA